MHQALPEHRKPICTPAPGGPRRPPAPAPRLRKPRFCPPHPGHWGWWLPARPRGPGAQPTSPSLQRHLRVSCHRPDLGLRRADARRDREPRLGALVPSQRRARSARIAGARLSVDSRVSEIAGCVSSSVRLLLSAQCHRGPSLSSQPAGFRPLHGPGDAVARAFHGSTHPPPVDAPGLPRLHCGGRMGGGEEIEPVTPTTVQVTEGTAASRGAWTSFARNHHRGARHL